MELESIAEKLDKYFSRLERGKAAKIKPAHVEKVIAKLQAKQQLLQEELRAAEKPSKKSRLENKLVTVCEQVERAEWLLDKIGT
jgi:uncharacterized protein YaiL (DUF2058 family)